MDGSALKYLAEVAHNVTSPNGRPIGVAVSGGGDSLAMLHLLHDAGHALRAVTVNHGLRPEAANEARFVAEVCAELGVPHDTLEWSGENGAGNLQDRARRARRGLIRDWAKRNAITQVALGHTQNDQAETFLMRLARGSGVDGLSAMSRRSGDAEVTWLRPFLGVRRSELRQFLRHRGLHWLDDPTNDDRRYDRVKARRALVCLEDLGISVERLNAVARNLGDVRHDLDLIGQAAFASAGQVQAGDVVIDWPRLRDATPGREVPRRTLVKALRWVSGADYPPRREAVAKLLSVAEEGGTHTLAGCLAVSAEGRLRITREPAAVAERTAPSDALWDGRWHLSGPHSPELEIRALGEAVSDTPWRETGLPRLSLMSSPAIWRGDTLVAAPLAGLARGWSASADGRGQFADFLIAR